MKYKLYNAEDFLFDESFRQWINGTSPQAAAFWEQWLLENPDRADVVKQAKELAHTLENYYQDSATEARIDSELQRLMHQAAERRDETPEAPVIPLPAFSRWRWAIAASVLVTLGLGIWLFMYSSDQIQEKSYAHLTQTAGDSLQEKINTSDQAMTILLCDGSLVKLQPNSRLSYPKRFSATSRTVYLDGEGFFDVRKNPARPFLIYANQTVTKVLGTSFLVRAFEKEESVMVIVQTGRVSVYKQQDYERSTKNKGQQVQGIILTPNQQMTYNLADRQLMKALVEKPRAIAPDNVNREQFFEDTPVTKIFSQISKTYGIKIIYDEENLSACLVNLTFSNESMHEQLDVICQTIGATYEILDGQIVIHSKGCQ